MTKPTNFEPEFDSSNFDDPIINPCLPLKVEDTWLYAHSDGGSNIVTVTDETITILGVECVVVTDNEFDEEGNPTEETRDYFATDDLGNVWYFGEDTRELPSNDPAGTWLAGQVPKDAEPGIIMPAPDELAVGLTYLEEQADPVALDRASVKSLSAKVDLEEFDVFTDVLKTKNDTSLDPGHVEHKYYVVGLGPVLITSGGIQEELVSFETGGEDLALGSADSDILRG
jgi:hypothetical protein